MMFDCKDRGSSNHHDLSSSFRMVSADHEVQSKTISINSWPLIFRWLFTGMILKGFLGTQIESLHLQHQLRINSHLSTQIFVQWHLFGEHPEIWSGLKFNVVPSCGKKLPTLKNNWDWINVRFDSAPSALGAWRLKALRKTFSCSERKASWPKNSWSGLPVPNFFLEGGFQAMCFLISDRQL